MIEIEILESNDPEIIGFYKTYHNQLLIGSDMENDIIIRDKKIYKFHLKLLTSKTGVYCENIKKNIFYFSNDKKISGRKIHNINDTIRISNTLIKIINFQHTHVDDYPQELQKMYREKCEQFPLIEEIFYFLKNELLFIQDKINKSSNPEKDKNKNV